MIMAKLTWRRGHLRHVLKGRNTNAAEAAVLIAGICRGINEKYTDVSPEELLRASQETLKAMQEEDEKREGLTVKCHLDTCDCEDLRDDGWCSRFGCYCDDIHCGEEREDE